MTHLVIINDPPYGTERAYNALRLARSLLIAGEEVRLFLMGDAVGCAIANQRLVNGYYKLDRMIASVLSKGGDVGACGTCMEARGLTEEMFVAKARRSSLDELTKWVQWADKVITF
jgi:uncharacterized protein involved in oxidation of intracellular sulfur